MKEPKPKTVGKRGPKPIYEEKMTRAKITCLERHRDYADRIGRGNISRGIRKALDYHLKHVGGPEPEPVEAVDAY